MSTSKHLTTSGSVGHFTIAAPDSVYFDGEPQEGLIKFIALRLHPLVAIERSSNQSFTVYGPWYSLLAETAKALNYSLVGQTPTPEMTENDVVSLFFTFCPDVSLIALSVARDSLLKLVMAGLMIPSRMVYVAEMDHILSARKHRSRNLMPMLTPFDAASLHLMSFGLLCIAFVARYFKVRPGAHAFEDVVWNLATALICGPQVTATRAVWRFVGITWLLGVFLLQQLFAGEMFQAMTLTPPLDVVDTFDDLSFRTSGTISLLQSPGFNASKYFSERKELVSRIRAIEGTKIFDLKELLENVMSGRQFHFGVKQLLELFQNDYFDGHFRNLVHISRDFGQFVPIFLVFGHLAESNVTNKFNEIIVQTQESGIYKKWEELKSYKVPKVISVLDYKQAAFHHFYGLFILCLFTFGLAFIVLCQERLKTKETALVISSRIGSRPKLAFEPNRRRSTFTYNMLSHTLNPKSVNKRIINF